MKVLSISRAESVRAVRIIAGDFGYLPDAAAAFTTQYGFLGPPKLEELAPGDATKGISFRQGRVEIAGKLLLIDHFQIFLNGLSVSTHTNTNDSDAILDHIMAWARAEFNFEFEDIKPGIGHSSQLEIRLEKSLPDLLPILSSLGTIISESLDEWWEYRPPYEIININFWFDKTKFPAIAPSIFRLDRREGVAFEQNIYWAEAPLSTQKHIKILSQLEKICLDALK